MHRSSDRGGGLGVWAAPVRFAKLSWRPALAVLLFLLLPLSASTTWGPRLPSAPAAAPIVVPLPDVAADVWASRGHVVHQEPYDPPLDDASVLGKAWRGVYTSVSGVDGGRRQVSGAFSYPPDPHRRMVGQSFRWPMAPPASDTTAALLDSPISWGTHR
jgi:hypothetical protein